MTVNRSDFQKQSVAGVTADDKFIVLDDDGTDEPAVVTAAGLAASAPFSNAYIPKSLLTTTGDLVTNAGGDIVRVTRSVLAQDTAFTSRYVPVTDDLLYVPATMFVASFGSPALGGVGSGSQAVWALDAASTEAISVNSAIPAYWNTFDVRLLWTNLGAGSGDVRWRVDRVIVADGATMSGAFTSVTATVAAPTQNVLKVTSQVVGAASTVNATDLVIFEVVRLGGDPDDTLGNDCGLLGMLLARAS